MPEYVILGNMFPPGMEEQVRKNSTGFVADASHTHLSAILDGLDKNLDIPPSVINLLPVPSYPKRYREMKIKGFSYSHAPGAEDYNVGYTNLTVWKKFSAKHQLNKAVKRYNGVKYIIVYNPSADLLKAAGKLKKRNPGAKICAIVPDLPKYVSLNTKGRLLYDIYHAFNYRKADRLVKKSDCFVFLTKDMAEYYGVKNSYIVMEALNKPRKKLAPVPDDDIKRITYTGTLIESNGIRTLLEAFSRIKDKNYRLVLCGGGDMTEELKSLSDPRIDFRGSVSRDELMRIQEEATVLVNPRYETDEATRYAFPSKVMEYMSAARPVVCFRLPGIPTEYDDYLIYADSPETLAEKLREVCSREKEELDRIGLRAKEFVDKNKNNIVQTKRLIELLQRKSVLFVMEDMNIGGSGSSLIELLWTLDKSKYDISLICTYNTGELMDRIPGGVRVLKSALPGRSRFAKRLFRIAGNIVHGMYIQHIIYRKRPLIVRSFQIIWSRGMAKNARRIKEHFDVVVGYMEGFPDYYAMSRKIKADKRVAVFHSDYKRAGLDPEFDKEMFSKADRIILVSEDTKKIFDKVFPQFAKRTAVAENTVSTKRLRKAAESETGDFAPDKSVANIVTAARLDTTPKRLDRIVKAAVYLKEQGCRFCWYVFGEGADRAWFEELIRKNGVGDCLKVMGKRLNIAPYVAQCDIFALTSQYEGKPMAVTEAMILGVIPVVTEYKSAKEQVKDCGIVCPNDDISVAKAIFELINTPEEMERLRGRLRERKYDDNGKMFEEVALK